MKLVTLELGKREMMAMPLLATAAAEEEEVEGKGGLEAASGRSPSPFSVFEERGKNETLALAGIQFSSLHAELL